MSSSACCGLPPPLLRAVLGFLLRRPREPPNPRPPRALSVCPSTGGKIPRSLSALSRMGGSGQRKVAFRKERVAVSFQTSLALFPPPAPRPGSVGSRPLLPSLRHSGGSQPESVFETWRQILAKRCTEDVLLPRTREGSGRCQKKKKKVSPSNLS